MSCGACCFSKAENYVAVTGNDHQRLGPNAEQWITWQNNRAFMHIIDGHCAALEIQPGANGPQFVCSIYDQRRKPAETSPAAPRNAKGIGRRNFARDK